MYPSVPKNQPVSFCIWVRKQQLGNFPLGEVFCIGRNLGHEPLALAVSGGREGQCQPGNKGAFGGDRPPLPRPSGSTFRHKLHFACGEDCEGQWINALRDTVVICVKFAAQVEGSVSQTSVRQLFDDTV